MPTASTRFRLISGNRLDRLAALLGERLATPLDVDSLAPDVILIPQPTLRHWLLQTLAERHGVAANLDLCTPSEFVWRLLRADRPDLPDQSPWDRDHLRWRLYGLLGAEPGGLPPPVRRHLQRAGGSGDPREIALARLVRLANAFGGHGLGDGNQTNRIRGAIRSTAGGGNALADPGDVLGNLRSQVR